MEKALKVIDGGKAGPAPGSGFRARERELSLLKNQMDSMMRETIIVWDEIYVALDEISDDCSEEPPDSCDIPESVGDRSVILGKMWLVRHYIEHVMELCEGKTSEL